MNATFRPIEEWPNPGFEPNRPRERSRFDSHWQATLDLLGYELARLGAGAVVIKVAVTDQGILRDGSRLKMNVAPEHPGIVVEWQIGEAWYRRAAEKYDLWQDNVRAIALTLEALRAVERWGAVSGEQYEGFRLELEAGALGIEGEAGESAAARAMPEATIPRRLMTRIDAAWFLSNHGGIAVSARHTTPSVVGRAYRKAAAKLHPDAGGDPQEFRRLQEARDVLLGGGS